MDRAKRGARRARTQELANFLTIKEVKDLDAEPDLQDLVPSDNKPKELEPVMAGGPAANSRTDDYQQVQDWSRAGRTLRCT